MVPLQARFAASRMGGWGPLFFTQRRLPMPQQLTIVHARRKNSSDASTAPLGTTAGAAAAPRKQRAARKSTDEQAVVKPDMEQQQGVMSSTSTEPLAPRELAGVVPLLPAPVDHPAASGDDDSSVAGSDRREGRRDEGFLLRPYQREAITRVLEAWRGGQNHQLVSMPTGTGKTVVFASLIRHIVESATAARPAAPPPRTLVLVHRAELLAQAEGLLKSIWPSSSVAVMCNARKETNGQILIATVQTAVNHLPALAAVGFALAVIDEAHHTVARSWGRVLEATGFLEKVVPGGGTFSSADASTLVNSSSTSIEDTDEEEGASLPKRRLRYGPGNQGKLLLGFTATAYRRSPLESRNLLSIYGPPVFALPLPAAVRMGALAAVVNERVVTQEDLSRVGLTDGDFAISQLSEICNSPGRNALVVETWRQLAGPGGSAAGPGGEPRKTIVFAVDRAHGAALADAFIDAGVPTGFIDGTLSPAKRQQTLLSFKAGVIQVLVNVSILTEGFDEPSVSSVFMARPTRSTGLYTQMVGRGLRRFPQKADCLVVDFTDSGDNHDIAQVVDWRMVLEEESTGPTGRDQQQDQDKSARVGAPTPWAPAPLMPAGFVWVRCGEHYLCSMFGQSRLWLVRQTGAGETGVKAEGVAAGGAVAAAGSAVSDVAAAAAAAASDTAAAADVQLAADLPVASDAAAVTDTEDGEEEDEETEEELKDDEEANISEWLIDNASSEPMYLPLLQPAGEDDPSRWQHIAGAHVPPGGVTLTWAQGLAEDWVAAHDAPAHRNLRSDARWRRQPASDAQLKHLKRLAAQGGEWATAAVAVLRAAEQREPTKGEVASAIDALQQAPASTEQRDELQALGVSWAEPLLARRASALIASAQRRASGTVATGDNGGDEADDATEQSGAPTTARSASWTAWRPGDEALTEKQLRFLRGASVSRPWVLEKALGRPGLRGQQDEFERALEGLSKRAASTLIGSMINKGGSGGGGGGGGARPPARSWRPRR